MKHKRILCAALLLALCLLLAACGKVKSLPAAPAATEAPPTSVHFAAGDVDLAATDLKLRLASGETALLDSLTALKTADFSGSENEEEVAAWVKAHPQIQARYTVTLPNGTALDSDAKSADLSSMSPADAENAARKLALLPGLTRVNLGREGDGFTWSDIARLREILPEVPFQYAFKLYGKDCDLSDTTINLFRVQVPDNGNLIDEVMGYMPQLTYVDMDSCGLEPKRLEEINLRHPDAKLVFRVYFGDNYTARTDAERILASMASRGGMLTNYNVDGLYYCHDVKYLDLGHNTELTDIGFAAQMPKLEVAIFSMCNVSDLTPLASCPELEYLELSNTYASDLRPLSGLKKLRHLNVASIGFDQPWDGSERIQLKDITPLYPLTELERLWIGAYNPVPPEQVEEMRRRAPNCEIDLTVYEDPVGGRWRYVAMADYINTYVDTYHERYVKLREQFGDYDYAAFNFTWNDPMLDPNYDPATAPTATPKPAVAPTQAPTYVQTYVPEEEEEEQYEVYTPPFDPYADNSSVPFTPAQPSEPENNDPGEGGMEFSDVFGDSSGSVAQTDSGESGSPSGESSGEGGGDGFTNESGGSVFPEGEGIVSAEEGGTP